MGGERRQGCGGARKGTLQEAPTQAWPQGKEKGAKREQGPVAPKMNLVGGTGKGWPGL